MKKIAFLLAAVLLFTLSLPFAVAAEEMTEGVVPSYIVSSEDGVQGGKVTVKIGIRDNPGIIVLRCHIFYDEEVLELVSVKDTKALNAWVEPKSDKSSPYTLYWEDALTTENNTVNGVIAELVFKVKNNAHAGKTEIRVEHADALAADGMDLLELTFDDGSAMLNVTPRSTFSLSAENITLICSIVAGAVVIAVIVAISLLLKKRKAKKGDSGKEETVSDKTEPVAETEPEETVTEVLPEETDSEPEEVAAPEEDAADEGEDKE